MSGSGGRFQLDLLSHVALPAEWLELVATGTQFGQNDVDTLLVDRAQTGIADSHVHPAVFALDPEATVLQVGQKTALGLVVGVGDAVPDHRLLAGYFTYSRHNGFSRKCTDRITNRATRQIRKDALYIIVPAAYSTE